MLMSIVTTFFALRIATVPSAQTTAISAIHNVPGWRSVNERAEAAGSRYNGFAASGPNSATNGLSAATKRRS